MPHMFVYAVFKYIFLNNSYISAAAMIDHLFDVKKD